MTTNTDLFTSTPELRSAAEDGVRVGAKTSNGGRTKVCSETAPSGIAFGAESENLEALDAALSQLEVAERRSRESEAARVAALAEIDRVARLEATIELGRRSTQRAAEDTLAYRAARADAAVMLHLSEQTVAHHLAQAATLTNSYPDTVASLASGATSIRHAAVIVDAGHIIGDPGQVDTPAVAENRAEYEAQVLTYAVAVTPPQLRPIARRIAETYAQEDLDARYEQARKDRKVWVTERENGLAEVGALLPAHEAFGVFSRLTQMAKRAQSVELQTTREAKALRDNLLADTSGAVGIENGTAAVTEPETWVSFSPLAVGIPLRTRGEIRADLFGDLLLNGTGDTATGGSGTSISGIVQVFTHAEHLEAPDCAAESAGTPERLKHTELPLPEMEGYGPIPVSMARDIASGDGTWNKISVNLATGAVLTVENYRPSEAIRRFLTARDQRCRFPGCRVPVHRCDFDHTIDAALGGPTSTTNLGALCRGHHILKHHSGWGIKQQSNSDYDWTSPTGRATTDRPISRVLFRPIKSASIERPKPNPEGRAPFTSRPEGRAPSEPLTEQDLHPF